MRALIVVIYSCEIVVTDDRCRDGLVWHKARRDARRRVFNAPKAFSVPMPPLPNLSLAPKITIVQLVNAVVVVVVLARFDSNVECC
jgi:hypothetical protein